jgi:prepilin-type N-terminal cleavage/methylation domain-containing protein
MNRRSRQAGFTLIELMVALIVSSLLVGMILAIFSRMSMAYRGQQQIAGVQQVLAAARATIEADAKQVGLDMPQMYTVGFDVNYPRFALQIKDNVSSTGPDQVAFMYADPSAQALVQSVGTWNVSSTMQFNVDPALAASFNPGDLAVFVTLNPATSTEAGVSASDPPIAVFNPTPCAFRIRSPNGISGGTITIDNTSPWGLPGSNQCTPPTPNQTMVYRFIAHAYRIDQSTPARAALGPLQQSPYGGMFTNNDAANLWTDIGYGFTDLQVSLQMYDDGGIDNADPDTDPNRNWYSDSQMTTKTIWNTFGVGTPSSGFVGLTSPIQLTISLVARTDRDVEGITTASTPALLDITNPGNLSANMIGNRAAIALPSATDPALQGSRIYRYITFQVDLRNMGVGR